MLENNDKLNCDNKVPENKISISEYDSSCNYVNLLVVKAKEKNNKQQLLKRLIFGLDPTLRSAVMKALVAKRKKLLLSDLSVDDFEGKSHRSQIIEAVGNNASEFFLQKHISTSEVNYQYPSVLIKA